MTQSEFTALCNEHLIDTAIALENEDICDALLARDDAAVIELLQTAF